MNKVTQFIYQTLSVFVVIGGVILAVALPIITAFSAPRERKVSAEAGFVDLETELAQDENCVYALEGQWEFYPGKLYTYDDFLDGSASGIELVDFPHTWTRKTPLAPTHQARYYGTYRLRIRVPLGIDAIGIHSFYQYSAFKIYLNNFLVGEAGRIDPSFEHFQMAFLTLNGITTEIFKTLGENECSIIIQVQNEVHSLPGLKGVVYIASSSKAAELQAVLSSINNIMIGWLFILMLYYFVVFLHNRERNEYFDYTFVTCTMLYTILSFSGGVMSPYRFIGHNPILTDTLLLRLDYFMLPVGAFFAGRQHLSHILSRKGMNIVYVAALLLFAGIMVMPYQTLTGNQPLYAMILAMMWLLPALFSIYLLIQKHNTGLDFVFNLGSSLFIVIAVFLYVFQLYPWRRQVDLFSLAINLHMLMQLVVFLRYYRRLENSILELNRDLEAKVEDRTRALIQMTENAEKARRQSDEASRYKSDFLAKMSHELRTPLNAIIGITDLMRTDNFDDTQTNYFKDMTKMSQTLLEIINDILDFSKIEAGKMELVPTHYNLRFLFDSVSSMCRFLAEGKNLKFSPMFTPGTPEIVYGDETRVRQIFVNLVNNAIKYTKEGYVEFILGESYREGTDGEKRRYIAAIINDTGIGIKDEDKAKLFGSFERFDESRNTGITGTGLGLAITRQLVDMMSGSISVQSIYGKGSTFTVYIPLIAGDPALVNQKTESTALVQASKNTKVLVVDDLPVNLTVMRGFLARHGITAELSENGTDALQKVVDLAKEGKHYDLIFMDHMMPGVDGLETTRLIRSHEDPQTVAAIIACSANVVQGAREMFLSAGMNDSLSKPVRPADLNKILEKWLPPNLQVQPAAPAASENAFNSNDSELHTVAEALGMNLNAALEFLVNGNGIRDYLLRFEKDYGVYLSALKMALESKDWKEYATRTHGFKGAFKTLGVEYLGERMRELESASKEGRIEECEAKTEQYIEELTAFHTKLRSLFVTVPFFSVAQKQDTDTEGKTQMSRKALAESLESLYSACQGARSREAARIVATLDAAVFDVGEDLDWPGTWTELRTLLYDLDYARAAEKIAPFLDLLRNVR